MPVFKFASLFLFLGLLSCNTSKDLHNFESDNLKIVQISKNTYQHISYLETQDFGKVACNGAVFVDNNEALIIDTPVNNSDSAKLLEWIKNELKCHTVGVVVTHFHVDCLGGLDEFHRQNIPSYSSSRTIEYARLDNHTNPQIGFKTYLEIKVGKVKVENIFLGEGHTRDNIVSYFPSENVLFGGCLIKSIGAGKGNLADANIEEWSKTAGNIKSKYPDVKIVIPGHGNSGGKELLDFTSDLFKMN